MPKTFTLTAAFICVCSTQLQSVAYADLVAHWTGDGTSADQTGGGHNGVLFSGPTSTATYSSGKVGQAFNFGGGGYMEVPNSTGLQPASITVAMWVKAAPSAGIQLLADSSHGSPGPNSGWALQLSGNRLSFAYGNGTTFPEVLSAGLVADNAFHHIAASLDGTTLRLYVDGTLDSTLAYTGTPAATTENGGRIRLGNHHHFARPVNGLIDDVRIYNTALSSAQVSALTSVPEPTSLACVSLLLLGFLNRRRKGFVLGS